MDGQVVEIINELVEVAMRTRRRSFQVHVDEELTETARTICNTDP
jgi:hypothetical protein